MSKWIDISGASDCPAGGKICLKVVDKPIVLINLDGKFLALANVCPHAGMPLGDGEVRGKVLVCPYHGYAYNVETGANIDFPTEELPVRTYPARVTGGGRVEIDLASDPEND